MTASAGSFEKAVDPTPERTSLAETHTPAGWRFAWSMLGKALTFQLRWEDISRFNWRCLVLGLALTWLAGMGRHWDDTSALHIAHRMGAGSLVYAFFLSLFLWLIVLPLRRKELRFLHMFTLVTFTGPLAFVYAIPIEWWTQPDQAALFNAGALAFVATYRVAMLWFFLWRGTQLPAFIATVVVSLPLCIILTVLGVLTVLESIAISMGGIRAGAPTIQDQIDTVISNIAALSFIALPVLFIIYIVLVAKPSASLNHPQAATRNP